MASPPGQHAWVPTCLVFLLSTCTFTGMRAAARGSKLGGPGTTSEVQTLVCPVLDGGLEFLANI